MLKKLGVIFLSLVVLIGLLSFNNSSNVAQAKTQTEKYKFKNQDESTAAIVQLNKKSLKRLYINKGKVYTTDLLFEEDNQYPLCRNATLRLEGKKSLNIVDGKIYTSKWKLFTGKVTTKKVSVKALGGGFKTTTTLIIKKGKIISGVTYRYVGPKGYITPG